MDLLHENGLFSAVGSTPSSAGRAAVAKTTVVPAALRIVLVKLGLDGHDRGIKVVARGLRDSGFHVIYGGIWQSPEAAAQAASDEDADWLGVSLLSGAHLSLVPRLIEQLRRRACSDIGLVVGGIIPDGDVDRLRELGVSGVFGPGTTIDSLAAFLRQRTPRGEGDPAELLDRVGRQDRRALARLLTLAAEDRLPHGFPLARSAVAPARTIALTGSAGVGKSSLAARLIGEGRRRGVKIGVLACDPASPLTGGALLGDRLRMNESQSDPNVFVRSLAVPSGCQGIAPHLDQLVSLLERFGCQVVLIETAGAGQGDVAVRHVADSVVLLLQPESGDTLQWDKAGLMEVADVLVLHKADLPGAEKTHSELHRHFLSPGCRPIRLAAASATANTGVAELWDMICR